MKRNTSVTLEEGDKEKIRSMGISVSSFTQKAVEILLSEGYDDYRAVMKVKLLEEDIENAEAEIAACRKRMEQLEPIIETLKSLHTTAQEELEISRTTGKLAKLTQKLNKGIILHMYDEGVIEEKCASIISEMRQINPEFDLTKHIQRLMKIMGY